MGHSLDVFEEALPLGLAELVAVGDEEQVGPQGANYRPRAESYGSRAQRANHSRTSAKSCLCRCVTALQMARGLSMMRTLSRAGLGSRAHMHSLRNPLPKGLSLQEGCRGPRRSASTGPDTTPPRGPARWPGRSQRRARSGVPSWEAPMDQVRMKVVLPCCARQRGAAWA